MALRGRGTLGGVAEKAETSQSSSSRSLGNVLRIFPPIVQFNDVQVGQKYTATVHVKNVDTRVRVIKVERPISAHFATTIPSTTFRLAPGLETSFEIVHTCSEEAEDAHDVVVVKAEGERIDLPLHARPSGAELAVRGTLDYGVVVVDAPATRKIVIENRGKRSGKWRANSNANVFVKLSASEGSLDPGEAMEISATIVSNELGAVKGTLELETSSGEEPLVVDVGATVVSNGFEIFHAGSSDPMHKIEFGKVFFGDTSVAEAEVVNVGPEKINFLVRLGHEKDEALNDDADASEEAEPPNFMVLSSLKKRMKTWKQHSQNKLVVVEPEAGTIPPYGKVKLRFVFRPEKESPSKGFSMTTRPLAEETEVYSYAAVIIAKNLSSRQRVPILGRGVRARVAIEPNIINFGDVEVNRQADLALTLKNESIDLPIMYRFPHCHAVHVSKREGEIQPSSVASLFVTYVPKSLGRFKDTLCVDILAKSSGKLRKISETLFHVSGFSSSIAPTKHHIGGVDKVPEDFTLARKFVVQANQTFDGHMRPPLHSRWNRPKLWETSHAIQTLTKVDGNNGNGGKMSLTLVEHQARHEHRERYADFIKAEREARQLTKIKGPKLYTSGIGEDPVNLGLRSRSGLREPQLVLPKEVCPLYMVPKDTIKNSLIRPRNKAAFGLEEEEFGLSQYGAKPTAAQRLSCATPLAAEEIAKIAAGPRILNFGSVSAYSSTKRTFGVTNDLNRCIQVTVHAEDIEELKSSGSTTQVIPPGATAGFPMILKVSKLEGISKSVRYTINEANEYLFDVTAEVVPVTLQLSKSTLRFSFSSDNPEEYVDESLVISNSGAQPAEFSWEGKNSAFAITPPHGIIGGKSHEEVKFRWRPGDRSNLHDATFTLRIVGGSGEEKRVRCIGEPPEGKCQFKDRLIDFKAVSVGNSVSVSVPLRNVGNKDTIFRVNDTLPKIVKCTPMRGSILAGSTQTLQLDLHPTEVMELDSQLCVNIRGGKEQILGLKANIIVPDVNVKEKAYEFDSVYMGGTCKRTCTLVNTSEIPVTVLMDFREQAAFSLDISRDNWSTDDYDEVPLTCTRAGDLEKGEGPSFSIVVAPHSELSLNIVFKPDTVTDYDFTLPLSMKGAKREISKLKRRVTARALRPRMLISNQTVNFGSKIVLRERIKKIPYSMDLKMENNDEVDFKWKFGSIAYENEQTMRNTFDLETTSGTLKPGESTIVKVTFVPRDNINYAATVPIALDGNAATDYVIELYGAGTHPQILCKEREIIMPSVPLGIRSTASFVLYNQGYDNLDLQYKLPADTTNIPLELSFPDGQMIGIAKEQLRVNISFCSDKPMSFTANVEFLDDDGNRFPVSVSGVADNSLLSLYPFLMSNKSISLQAVGKQPVMIEESDFNMPPPPTEDSNIASECTNIVRFFNASTMMGPFGNIVEAIISSKGHVFLELLEFYTGKPVPGKINRFSTQKKEQTDQLITQYEKLLIYLKTHGALLNSIKPEYLVDIDDFRRIVSTRQQKAETEYELEQVAPWKRLEERFTSLSTWAWSMMLQQLVKVCILSRIGPRQYKQLPNIVTDTTPDSSLSGSNFYSVSESVLLKWMTTHFTTTFPSASFRVTNFDEHLRSGLVIFSLLQTHWPSLHSLYPSLKKDAKNESDMRNNAKIVLTAIRMLELPFGITEEEIVKPDPREMLIFVLYLYQTLPQFLPHSTVNFVGKLGDTIKKAIEITNPTGRVVAYNARLEGSSDFKLLTKTVRVEPKSSVQVTVECVPKISRPVSGFLILQSSREGAAFASTNVFQLHSNIQQDLPLQQMTISGNLYDFLTKDIEIKNPYPVDCEFAITVSKPVEEVQEVVKVRPGMMRKEPKKKKTVLASTLYPDAFGCDRRTIRIRKGESSRISVAFLPFTLGRHLCHIQLSNSEYGHFVYAVVGNANLPNPLPLQKFTIEPKGQVTKEMQLSFQNSSLETAKRVFLDRHPLARNQQQADLARTPVTATSTKYKIQAQSSYIAVPPEITLQLPNVAKLVKKEGESNNTNSGGGGEAGLNLLPIAIEPKGPGIYPCRVVLTSSIDVRVIDVEFTAAQTAHTASLEFECTALQEIVQDIPLINSSDKVLAVRASISGTAFHGPREMNVDPYTTTNYHLHFKPPWVGEYDGELQLHIVTTGESSVYKLRGVADDPVAEDHIVLSCQAREQATTKLTVPNVDGKDVVYSVYSDLHFVFGESKLKVRKDGSATFELGVRPPKSGLYKGSITFSSTSGHYVWYTLVVEASTPPPLDTIIVTTPVRQASMVAIELTNPLSTTATLNVLLDGVGLSGPESITLVGGETKNYEMMYLPLAEGKQSGSINFVSELLGEFKYIVELNADAVKPEELPALTCDLGSQVSYPLHLTNPGDAPVSLTGFCSNTQNFALSPLEVTIPPRQSAEVEIIYTASSLGVEEGSEIRFEDPGKALWVYKVTGMGKAPSKVDVISISSAIRQSGSGLVTFKNPFPETLTINVSLHQKGREEDKTITTTTTTTSTTPFEMMMKKLQGVNVPAFGSIQLPVSFSPDRMLEYTATLVITADNLTWKYEMRGLAEALVPGPDIILKTRSRKLLTTDVEISLPGIDPTLHNEEYSIELSGPQSEMAAITSALKVIPLDDAISGESVRLRILFSPLRVLATSADILIVSKMGGRWRQ